MININRSEDMKKSLLRIDKYIKEFNPKYVYVIANNQMLTKMYIKYISDSLEINKNKLIMITDKVSKSIELNDSIAILCAHWYKNPLVKKYNLLDAFNHCITIPIDEIER